MGQATAKPGWVYVLDPHLEVGGRRVLKIGYTTRTVKERVRELSTGMVGGFRVAHERRVTDAPAVERRVHSALAASRVNREFFAVSVEEATAAIDRAVDAVLMQDHDFAWKRGMQEFKERTGIAVVEKAAQAEASRAMLWTMGVWTAACAALAWFISPFWLFAILGGLIAGAWVESRQAPRIREKMLEPYREQIAAEAARLDARYPMSFSARYARGDLQAVRS